jgi:hypothetical protein
VLGPARPLGAGDAVAALRLLRERPVHNVFLEHAVRSGALGPGSGCLGAWRGERLQALCMIGPLGSTVLEVRDPGAFQPLAEAASKSHRRPRHLVGSEDVTGPFFEAYRRHAPAVRWQRREPVYLLRRPPRAAEPSALAPARESDLDEVVQNSAAQHREDLDDDRLALDPGGFRRRHALEIRERRWWVLREGGRIGFQVHVGPENADVVQIGGVFTPPELRNRGVASRGVAAIGALLLRRKPMVSLFCAETNAPARRVYEKTGFEVAFHYRSFLLEERGH